MVNFEFYSFLFFIEKSSLKICCIVNTNLWFCDLFFFRLPLVKNIHGYSIIFNFIFQFCIEKGGILIELHNADEADFFNTFLTNTENNNKKNYWIGLSDIKTKGKFVWNSSLENVMSFANWNLTQPSSSQGCVYTITHNNRSWVVGDCEQSFFGVCQIGKTLSKSHIKLWTPNVM